MLRINVGFHFNIFTVDSSIILLKTVNIFTTLCNSHLGLRMCFPIYSFWNYPGSDYVNLHFEYKIRHENASSLMQFHIFAIKLYN